MADPWTRRVTIGPHTLYEGDCRKILRGMGRFDACVTDPPYGIGRDGEHADNSGRGGRRAYAFKGWDNSRPPPEVFDSIFYHSREQIIWGGNYFADLMPASRGWLVWDKGQRLVQSDAELAYTSLDAPLRVFTLNRAAIARDGAVHPTQKPLALMEWCLGFIPDAQTIIDPFMGSGTTLLACMKAGKVGVGIERDPEFFDIACRRIEDAMRQPDMFTAPPPAPVQEALF